MDDLHVVPDTRKATWSVRDAVDAVARSQHETANEAESAACSQAASGGADRVVVHDRYARTREIVRRGRRWLQRR